MAAHAQPADPVGAANEINALKRERDRFVALAFCAADMLIEVDRDFGIVFAAGATRALTGMTPETLIGRALIDLISEEDKPLIGELVRGMKAGRRLEPVPVRLRIGARKSPAMLLTGYHLPELPDAYFFALRLTGGAAAAMGEEPDRDPVTGLLTSESFAETAARRIGEAAKSGDDLKLTLVKLQDFAQLRARLDREASESLQKTIGACLRVSAGASETAAAFDDSSYGLLHRPDADIEEMRLRLEGHLREADPDGEGVPVAASTLDTEVVDVSPEHLNQAILFSVRKFCDDPTGERTFEELAGRLSSMANEASTRMTQFKQIVSAENFDVAFQPVIELENRKIHHFEALARFGGGSDRSPYELISFAENTGLICDFDYAMTRRMLQWLDGMRQKGRMMRVAVNLSGHSVGNTTFLTALKELLARHDGLRSQLLIEITESSQIRDLKQANSFIQSLREDGHVVCLDDFGAGAAALRYLHELDVDVVKIDGQYVQGAGSDRKVRAFLRAIAGLCNELNIDTIAEMVEDQPTVRVVEHCGIRFAQGYLFGKPSKDIGAFLRRKDARAAAMPASAKNGAKTEDDSAADAGSKGKRPWVPGT